MTLEHLVAIAVAVLLTIYLGYALLRAERF